MLKQSNRNTVVQNRYNINKNIEQYNIKEFNKKDIFLHPFEKSFVYSSFSTSDLKACLLVTDGVAEERAFHCLIPV